jgi:hypothetical protein
MLMKIIEFELKGGKTMRAFRVYMVILFMGIVGYTGVVILDHGWNLFAVFFGNIAAMTWAGQFNFDFMLMLSLSGLWIAWRHQFTPVGLALGVLAFFGGIMFLSLYLLIASFLASGDGKELLLGKVRSNS